MEKITKELLIDRGFEESSDHGVLYRKEIVDFEMDDGDWATLIVRQGNGSDPDYWGVSYHRKCFYQAAPTSKVTLLNGIKDMAKIDALIFILHHKDPELLEATK